MPGTSNAAAPVMKTCISDREPEVRGQREHGPRDADDRADDREHAEAGTRVAQHQPRRERDAEQDRDDLRGLGERGDQTALELVEAEDLVVVERRQRDQADERGGEERQRVPDAPQRADLPQDADRLRERRRDLVGADHRRARACARALPMAAAGLLQAKPHDHEHDARDHEHDERDTPVVQLAEEARDEGTDERADREADRVEAEDVGPHVGRVVVGEQRVVGRRDDRAADAGNRPDDDEHQRREHERGEQSEHGPDRGTDDRERDARDAIGVVRERHGEEEPAELGRARRG